MGSKGKRERKGELPLFHAHFSIEFQIVINAHAVLCAALRSICWSCLAFCCLFFCFAAFCVIQRNADFNLRYLSAWQLLPCCRLQKGYSGHFKWGMNQAGVPSPPHAQSMLNLDRGQCGRGFGSGGSLANSWANIVKTFK